MPIYLKTLILLQLELNQRDDLETNGKADFRICFFCIYRYKHSAKLATFKV